MNAAGLALVARALAGEKIIVVQLVRVNFSPPLYLTTGGRNVDWGGHTWVAGALGDVEAVEDSADEMLPLRFTLPGLNEDQIAVALEPGTEGKLVQVWDAWIDPDDGQCADACGPVWSGTLNVPQLTDGVQADLTVTAEHGGVTALRPRASRYTNAEQLRRFPGDTCLDRDPGTDAAPVKWPAASYWER